MWIFYFFGAILTAYATHWRLIIPVLIWFRHNLQVHGFCHGFCQTVEELNGVLCLTCLLSNELLDICFNIFHGESLIFCYEVSWCSHGIGDYDDIRPCFHSQWLLRPLCQLIIEQVDRFGFSVKSLWGLKDEADEELDACGGGVVSGYWRIGLSGSQVECYRCWDIRFRIEFYSSSFWKRSSSASTGCHNVDMTLYYLDVKKWHW